MEEIVTKLLRLGAEITQKSTDIPSPLAYAIQNGHQSIAAYLLQAKGNPNEVGHNNQSLLAIAAV